MTSSRSSTTINKRTPPPPLTFSVGGTVSGLLGTGLVLQQAGNGTEIEPVADGAFTFATRLSSGAQYDVRVGTQPTNPIQVCTVANGTGTIDHTDVTNVQVICITPPPQGSLDPTFGSGGKVTEGLPGGATAMALQDDGKIVLLGGMKLARYNPDGTIDANFGTGGTATVVFNAGLLDVADDVAIQPDGKIVVVGITRVGTQDDFAVARFNPDGTSRRELWHQWHGQHRLCRQHRPGMGRRYRGRWPRHCRRTRRVADRVETTTSR